jgi:hypothetical protein
LDTGGTIDTALQLDQPCRPHLCTHEQRKESQRHGACDLQWQGFFRALLLEIIDAERNI